jgi:4-amino-4-deoxy-L-arabinose transferase-like glycosyltransferase
VTPPPVVGSLLIGILTLFLTYSFGKRWKDKRIGLLSTMLLGTSLLFVFELRFSPGDMLFAFWLLLALYANMGMMSERLPERIRRFSYLFAVALAGGILTNGPAALLPLAVLFLTASYARLWSPLAKVRWLYVSLFSVILVGIGYAASPGIHLQPAWGPPTAIAVLIGFLPFSSIMRPLLRETRFRRCS